jgi:hypothetical protein
MFRPKHTFQSVTKDLIEGLEAGSITLRPMAAETQESIEVPEVGSVGHGPMANSKDLQPELDRQVGMEAMHFLLAAQVGDLPIASYVESLPEAESQDAALTAAWFLVQMSRSSTHEG